METYSMTIAGLKRELPICSVDDTLDIAAFILFGDVEMTVAASRELLKRAPEFDIIFTPEAKSIPLAYEMSRQCHKPYTVARKGIKVYMQNPISVTVHSITTQTDQTLYLGNKEVTELKGKRVLIIDDVISTGESIAAVKKMVEITGGKIVGIGAVLAEGDSAKRHDIFYLEALPIFTQK